MPLKPGSSKKTISSNVGELMSSYKKKGTLGTSHPKSKAKARKQAIAIAMSKAGKNKKTHNECFNNAVNRVLSEAFEFKIES